MRCILDRTGASGDRTAAIVSAFTVALLVAGALQLPGGSDADSGGLDETGHGYVWMDNRGPAPHAVYDWKEIRFTGTAVTSLTDDSHAAIPLPFDFEFYGESCDTIYASSNGYVDFGSPNTDHTDYSNDPIPDTNDPDNMAAVYWDDLNPSYFGFSNLYYKTTGQAPSRTMIVEWYRFPHYSVHQSTFTFQCILYEGSNELKFQYREVFDCETGHNSFGNSATIGLENADGTSGVQYTYNSRGSVIPGLAVLFQPRSGALDVQVDDLDLSTMDPAPGEMVSISANVTNLNSAASLVSHPVSLVVDGVTVATAHVDLAPGETVTVWFNRTFTKKGAYALRVETAAQAGEKRTWNNRQETDLYVNNDEYVVGFLVDNRGRPSANFTQFCQGLRSKGYSVVDVESLEELNSSVDLLIINRPLDNFDEDDRSTLKSYVEGCGSLMVLGYPYIPYYMDMENGSVDNVTVPLFDISWEVHPYYDDPDNPFVMKVNGSHPISQGVSSLHMPMTLGWLNTSSPGLEVVATDPSGPLVVARCGKVVSIASPHIMDDLMVGRADNWRLLNNSLRWLVHHPSFASHTESLRFDLNQGQKAWADVDLEYSGAMDCEYTVRTEQKYQGGGLVPDVLYYDFDSAVGSTVPDVSTRGGNDGVIHGAPYLVPDGPNGGMALRSPIASVNDRLQVTGPVTNFDMDGDFTFMSWVRVYQHSGGCGIMGFGTCCDARNGYTMNVNSDGRIRFWGGIDANNQNYNIYSTSTITDGGWHHVAMVVEGSTLTIYIDGAANTNGWYQPPTSPSQAVGSHISPHFPVIASDGISVSNGADISVDDVAIFTGALTPQQVVAAMGGMGGEGWATVYHQDFELGIAEGWRASGLWHATDHRCSPNGTNTSAAYNIEQTHEYDDGDRNWGYLVSPPIDISGVTDPVLCFSSWHETEYGYSDDNYWDHREVNISYDGGHSWLKMRWDDPSSHVAPLRYSAHNWYDYMWLLPNSTCRDEVIVRFSFDTGDDVFNDYEGWYVDDVMVKGTPRPSWLVFNPSGGPAVARSNMTLNVTVDTSGLEAGSYGADIVVGCSSCCGCRLRIPVNLVVAPVDNDIRVDIVNHTHPLEHSEDIHTSTNVTNAGNVNQTNILVRMSFDGIVQASHTIPFLAAGDSLIVNFTAPSRGFPGRPDVRVWAKPVPGEKNVANNDDHVFPAVRDYHAPRVVSVSPADGAKDVPGTSLVTVGFSEAMDTDSVVSSIVMSPKTDGAWSWSRDRDLFIFTPSQSLWYFTDYTITVKASASDLAGNGMTNDGDWKPEGSPVDDYTWGFNVEDREEYQDDNEGPRITSGPTLVYRSDSKVRIFWTTNEPASSLVEYGTDSGMGTDASGPDDVTEHIVTLTGLSADTQYHYRVGGEDADGNGPTWSSPDTFRTMAPGESTLASIEVTPRGRSITTEETLQFYAAGYDSMGREVWIAPEWSASSGSISPSGLFWPSGGGTVTITAREGGTGGEAVVEVIRVEYPLDRVKVTPSDSTITADDTLQLQAVAYDTKGGAMEAAFEWSASGGSVSAEGLFTPDGTGYFRVGASTGGESGSAWVRVEPGAPAQVTVTPVRPAVYLGVPFDFDAMVTDGKGNVLEGAAAWSASGGSVDGDGVYTAGSAGNGSVTATAGAASDTVTFTVLPPPITDIDLTPDSPYVRAGGTVSFTVTGADALGDESVIPSADITWYVSPLLGSVDTSTGTFTAERSGTVTVTAEYEGLMDDVRFTIHSPPPPDMDGDGIPDAQDLDMDGDGVPNNEDAFPEDPSETHDLDGDGIGDNADPDDDGDGVPDDEDEDPGDPNVGVSLAEREAGEDGETDWTPLMVLAALIVVLLIICALWYARASAPGKGLHEPPAPKERPPVRDLEEGDEGEGRVRGEDVPGDEGFDEEEERIQEDDDGEGDGGDLDRDEAGDEEDEDW